MEEKKTTPNGNEVSVEKKGFVNRAKDFVKETGGKVKTAAYEHRGKIGAFAGFMAGVGGAIIYGLATSGQKAEPAGIPEQQPMLEEEPEQTYFEDPQVEVETETTTE